MQSLNTLALVLFGIVLAAANIWVCAARSYIPMQVSGSVTSIEMRREKHPGKDDVHLIRIDDGRLTQVDATLAAELQVGSAVDKAAWQSEITIDGRTTQLAYSEDLTGMLYAMPCICLIIAATVSVANRRLRSAAE